MAILRTNYRKTGGIVDAVAIAGHMMSTCAWGDSAGFRIDQFPNGGFMLMSITGSIQGAEATAEMWQASAGIAPGSSGPTGCSRAWIESTQGFMSRWNGNPVAGYLFRPFGFRFLSFSNVGYLNSAGDQSIPKPHLYHVSYTGSTMIATILLQLFESGMSVSLRGTAVFRAQVWGFIVSAP